MRKKTVPLLTKSQKMLNTRKEQERSVSARLDQRRGALTRLFMFVACGSVFPLRFLSAA